MCQVLVLIVMLLSSSAWAYDFKHYQFQCTDPNSTDFVDVEVEARVNLENTGGRNIWYLATNKEQRVLNLYGDANKEIILRAHTGAGSGANSFDLDVSANYGDLWTVAVISCEVADMSMWYYGLMGLAGILCAWLLWWAIKAAFLN